MRISTIRRAELPCPRRASRRSSGPTTTTSGTSNRCSTSQIRTQGHELMVEGQPARHRARRAAGRAAERPARRRPLRCPTRDVKTAAQLVADDAERRSARSLPQGRPAAPGRRSAASRPKSRQPAPLSRRHRAARHRVRHRPGRHRQDLPRDGAGGELPARQEGQPHHPGAAGGRSGREARLPARRPAGEGQPVPAAALRRALRHARRREGRAAVSSAAPSKWRRSPSCAAAR